MTWLTGSPHQVRSIIWPQNGFEFIRQENKIPPISVTSILDDRICHSAAFKSCNDTGSPETAVFYADLCSESDVHVQKIAQISLYLSSVELLPRSNALHALFASAQFDEEGSQVILRAHAQDGSVIKQHVTSARAAYGRLVVYETTIALCISSGNPASHGVDAKYLVDDTYQYCINNISSITNFSENYIADQIILWNILNDNVNIVDIPQLERAPMMHGAQFHFISPDTLAVAGRSYWDDGDFDEDVALLKCFSVRGDYQKNFAQTPHVNWESIYCGIGRPSTSVKSDIFVHFHDGDAPSRISVFRKDLLRGDVESTPMDWCDDLYPAWEQLSSHRVLKGSLSSLSAIAGNRVLVRSSLNSYSKETDEPFMVLDFDSERVKHILGLDLAARTRLENSLAEDKAHVKVVTRRSTLYVVNDEEDAEYLAGEDPPPEWRAHLSEIKSRNEACFHGYNPFPVLEFDEAPEESRGKDLFGFIESRVILPESLGLIPQSLEIVSLGLVHVGNDPYYSDGTGWLVLDFYE